MSVIADPYTPTIKRSWPTVLSTTIIVQESIAFDVACADTDGNLVRVDWYIDGDFSHSSTVTSYCDQASWKKRFSSEGVYNIWAIAVNSDGNTDETAWKISVEGAPVRRHMPTIKRTLPPVYASIVSVDKKMNFGVECTNADGNLSRVDWYVDDAFSHSSRVSGDYNLAGWNKGFSSEGVHKIRAVIIDLNGNTDETAWKIKVAPLKEHDPQVSPKTPDSPVNLAVQDQMTFEVDAIDPDGDLRGLEWQYRIGDGEWQDADDRNRLSGDRGSAAHTHTFTSEGMWHIKAIVHDCRDAVASCTWFVSVKTSANRPPSTPVTEISGQPAIMCSNVQYAITANYYDPDGADDLHYCYLCLDHPNVSGLIMMWDHNTGDYSVWAGDSGDDYLTLEDVQVSLISGSPEGYRLTWKFIINQDWPEVNTGIRFGVYAEDDGRLAHGWKYGNPDTGFTNRFWWSKFSNSVLLHTKKGDPQTNGVIEFSTKEINSVAKDAFLQFGLNIGTRTADSVGRFIQSVGSWGNKTPGTILKSYASSESYPEFSDELYLVMGEEFIPIMTYNIGDETGWYYGFEIIVYRKEGGVIWIPVETVSLATPDEVRSVKWGWNNYIAPRNPISIKAPGIYCLTGGCKIVVSEGSEGTPPTCRIREPYSDGTFSGDVPVSATANDNVSVAYVQFQYSLDQVDWHALPAGEQDDPANDAKDWHGADGWGFTFDTLSEDSGVWFPGNLNAEEVWVRARAVDTSGNHSAWGECDHPFSVNNNMDDVPTANAPSPDEPVDELTGSLLTTISESSILDDGDEDTKEADETIIFTLSNTNNAKVDMPNTDVLIITDVVDDNDGKFHTGVGKTLHNISKAESDNDTTVIHNVKDLDDVHRVTDLETEE